MADELKVTWPDTPTTGLSDADVVDAYTDCNGCVVVEFSNLIVRLPLTPFSGSKKATTPLFPAGHATSSRGPITLKLLPGTGLVTTTCALE